MKLECDRRGPLEGTRPGQAGGPPPGAAPPPAADRMHYLLPFAPGHFNHLESSAGAQHDRLSPCELQLVQLDLEKLPVIEVLIKLDLVKQRPI